MTNFYRGRNESVRQVSADLSNWLIGTARKTSRGFESQAEMVFAEKLWRPWSFRFECRFELKKSGINIRHE